MRYTPTVQLRVPFALTLPQLLESAMSQLRFARAIALAACCVVALSAGAYAQGVTTASITGVVKEASGGVIPGASSSAVHQPSGASYQASRQAGRRTRLPGPPE